MANATKAKSDDPSGHLKLSVRDFGTSKTFYVRLFVTLGFVQIADKEHSAGWATKEKFGIWIAQAEIPEPQYVFSAPGFHHLCVKASSESQVDQIYEMVKGETRIFNPPRKYPEYTPDYYAVFFADPDGMKIEVAYY